VKTTVATLIFSFGFLLGCEESTTSDSSTKVAAKTSADGVTYTLSIPQVTFMLTEPLELTFRAQNISLVIKEFHFDYQQQFGFHLTDASGNIALYYPMLVSDAISSFVLQPGESKVFSMTWPLKDQNEDFISRGTYVLSAYLTENRSPAVSLQVLVQ